MKFFRNISQNWCFAITISLCLFFISSMPNFSQSNQKSLAKKDEDSKDWQRVELELFSFLIPKSFKKIETRCYESGCHSFEDNNISLNIDINYDAFRPNLERNYADYKENVYDTNNGKAWAWFYQRESKYKSGVIFYLDKPKDKRVGIYLSSTDKNVFKVAEKVFKSVEFNSQPK
jgi:hypothetical protein